MKSKKEYPWARSGAMIRLVRRRLGMDQRELGTHLGIGQSAVSQIELGATRPKLEFLRIIAELAGIPVSDLLDMSYADEEGGIFTQTPQSNDGEVSYLKPDRDLEAIEAALLGMEGAVQARLDQGQTVTTRDRAKLFRSLYKDLLAQGGKTAWTSESTQSTKQPTELPPKPCLTNNDSQEL